MREDETEASKELRKSVARWRAKMREVLAGPRRPPLENEAEVMDALRRHSEAAAEHGIESAPARKLYEQFASSVPNFAAVSDGLTMMAISLKLDLIDHVEHLDECEECRLRLRNRRRAGAAPDPRPSSAAPPPPAADGA